MALRLVSKSSSNVNPEVDIEIAFNQRIKFRILISTKLLPNIKYLLLLVVMFFELSNYFIARTCLPLSHLSRRDNFDFHI
jgi:hypothetical protein